MNSTYESDIKALLSWNHYNKAAYNSSIFQHDFEAAQWHLEHTVDVVKPLIARKRLVKLASKDGPEVSRRWSPKQGTMLDLFDELLYFTRVFPHENLRLIVPLVEIEEFRYPGHGKRRRWRRNDFVIADRKLVSTVGMEVFETATDLHRLLPSGIEAPFDTGSLANGLGIRRWQAQRIAYVMNKTGALSRIGKKGNAFLYDLSGGSEKSNAGESPDTPRKKKQTRKKSVNKTASKKTAARKKTKKKTVGEKTAKKKSTGRQAAKKKAGATAATTGSSKNKRVSEACKTPRKKKTVKSHKRKTSVAG